ncbi:hypothetical protein [Rathayibacter caricis]|uniref:hypothetical protein n=1 Tax=Rathayibacter caricis TaxID=110936 RepID=UPI0011B2954E|nr:hypothetical protein [Rathayibacter caricis]
MLPPEVPANLGFCSTVFASSIQQVLMMFPFPLSDTSAPSLPRLRGHIVAARWFARRRVRQGPTGFFLTSSVERSAQDAAAALSAGGDPTQCWSATAPALVASESL